VYGASYWPFSRYGSCRARKNDVLYVFGGMNYYNPTYGDLPMNDLWAFNTATPTAGWMWYTLTHYHYHPVMYHIRMCMTSFVRD
jgi:hypothetical protein